MKTGKEMNFEDMKLGEIKKIVEECCEYSHKLNRIDFLALLHTMIDEHCDAHGIRKREIIKDLQRFEDIMMPDEKALKLAFMVLKGMN